ncbi:unnamed protein product [Effrenium voratum]|nr:unnamed protein product [Effrenium voratum]
MAEPAERVQALPRFSRVEVPGKAKNLEEAVAAVGGRKAVAEALDGQGRLRFRLCRQYQFQAPLPMKRHRTSDLLVRAKRKADGTWDCQPVAWVATSFQTEDGFPFEQKLGAVSSPISGPMAWPYGPARVSLPLEGALRLGPGSPSSQASPSPGSQSHFSHFSGSHGSRSPPALHRLADLLEKHRTELHQELHKARLVMQPVSTPSSTPRRPARRPAAPPKAAAACQVELDGGQFSSRCASGCGPAAVVK